MRILSGVEAPDAGTRTEGHQVVMQYFAQDEATRLEPTQHGLRDAGGRLARSRWCRRSAPSSAASCSRGDDIYKKAGVLSGGERTRLAVARMLLRPANTLLLDEPTNHLDMDSKDVLLDALEDFGGTLILVSHDRYFIDRLATKVIDVGGGAASVYPGGYEDYRWSLAKREEEAAARPRQGGPVKRHRVKAPAPSRRPPRQAGHGRHRRRHGRADGDRSRAPKPAATSAGTRDERKRQEAEERRRKRAREAVEGRIAALEGTHRRARGDDEDARGRDERAGFYENHDASKPVIDQHQALMWELGDLMHRWEELQQELEAAALKSRRPGRPPPAPRPQPGLTRRLRLSGSSRPRPLAASRSGSHGAATGWLVQRRITLL